MNPDFEAELNAELKERRAKRVAQDRVDHAAAIGEFIQLSRKHLPNAEPLARSWKRDGLSLDGIRERSALSSSDFASALEKGTQTLFAQRFADLSGDVKAICADFPVDNYRPQAIATLGLKVPSVVTEDMEPPRLPVGVVESTEKGLLKNYSAKMAFNYQIWVTKGETILAGLNEYAHVFSLLEVQNLVSKVESSSLPTSTTTSLNAAGLGKAAAALRLQKNSAGQAANLSIATIVVPPDLEISAKILAAAVNNAIKVVVLPFTSATTFYVLADPQISAPFIRLTLRNSQGPRLDLNRRRPIYEGAEFAISHDFGFAFLDSQPGVLKCTP